MIQTFRQIPKAALGLLVLTACLFGCSPNVASVEEGASNPASGSTEVRSNEAPPAPTLSQKSDIPNSPFDAAMPGGGGAESIDEALSKMTPDQHTEVMLRYVSLQLLLYFSMYREYPSSEQGLDLLLGPVPPPPSGRGKYEPIAKPEHLKDGWGNKLTYEEITLDNGVPGFKLRSLGADGILSDDDRAPDMEDDVAQVTEQILAGALDK